MQNRTATREGPAMRPITFPFLPVSRQLARRLLRRLRRAAREITLIVIAHYISSLLLSLVQAGGGVGA
jgi:hypothetical protein